MNPKQKVGQRIERCRCCIPRTQFLAGNLPIGQKRPIVMAFPGDHSRNAAIRHLGELVQIPAHSFQVVGPMTIQVDDQAVAADSNSIHRAMAVVDEFDVFDRASHA